MKIINSSFLRFITRKEILLYLVLFVASLSILGWLFGKIIIASVSLKFIPIAPSTAILFFILSILLLVNYNFGKSLVAQSFTTPVILLAALFCLLVFLDYIFKFKWDIENIFIANPEKFGSVSIGRMSPITSILFFFTCLSILAGMQHKTNAVRYIGGSISLLTCFAASVLSIGYLYQAPLLYGSQIIPVALPTALCFLLFSITLLRVSELKFWTFNLIKKNPTEFLLLKTFIPLVVFVVILQGFLETNFSANHNNPTLTSAVVILIIVVITILAVIKASTIIGGKLSRAENALRESESHTRAMYQAIPDLLFRLDRQGVFLDYKADSKDLYIQSNEGIIGKHVRDITPPDFAGLIDRQIYMTLQTKTLQTFEYQLPIPTRGVRYYEARMVVSGDDEVTASVRDITDRKLAEAALLETNAYLENLINYANAPIIVWDPNFCITRFNHAFESLTGRTEAEVLGQSLDILFPPEYAENSMALIRKTLTGERFETVEIKIQHQDKSMQTVLWNSATIFAPDGKTLVATIAQGHNITLRKLAEENLLKNKALLNETERTGKIGGWEFDVETMIQSWTDETFRILEIDLTEGEPKVPEGIDFIEPGFRPMAEQAIQRAIEFGEPYDQEWQIKTNKGNKRWVHSVARIYQEQGKTKTISGSFQDITDRKRVDEEIKVKNEELIRLNAEKDKFFSIIAHDLRSPFSSFLGLTQIMAKELPKLTMAEIQQIAVSMEKSATNLYRLLENLLEWSLIERGLTGFDPKSYHLMPKIEESLHPVIESAGKKGIEISYDIPENIQILADDNMLKSTIRNLISNAVKFSFPGGKIILSAKISEGSEVEISVRDSGIGMKRDMLSKLFHADEQTNRKGTDGEPSTGLGLILCKDFVEKHGGKIWVESEEGKGSTFYFTIPGTKFYPTIENRP